MPKLAEMAGTDVIGAKNILWNTYDPYSMWAIFAAIGVGSLLMLMAYNKVVNAANKDPKHHFNSYGNKWVLALLVPITFILIGVTAWRMTVEGQAADSTWSSVVLANLGLALNATFFLLMLIIAFLPQTRSLFGSSKSTEA